MTATHRQRIEFEVIDNVRVVRFLDKVISQIFGEADDVEALGRRLDVVIDEIGSHDLLLDFSQVEHMASYMVAKLIVIDRKVRNNGGRFKICGMHQHLRNILRIVNIKLPIYPDLNAAMDAFASDR